MNIRRPLRGNKVGCSPVERFGLELQGDDLYDLLFHRTAVDGFDVAIAVFELELSGGGSLVVWT